MTAAAWTRIPSKGFGTPSTPPVPPARWGWASRSSAPASFSLSRIDRMPLGDMAGTVTALIRLNPGVDFVYRHTVDGRSFEMDTRELRAQLGDVPLSEPDVMEWIDGYLREQEDSLGGTA